MQLLIDNKPVIVKKGTSIRLTRENPAISQNGDYTLDVTIPLAGCLQNINVFGIPHYRHQPLVGLADKTYQFALEASRLRLTGTAVVTNVSEEEIKLQLLAGNTELNFDNREGGEKYIDELDLGRAYGDIWDDEKNYTTMPEEQTPSDTLRLLYSKANLIPTRERADELMHGTSDKTDCVQFPIYSTTDANFANAQTWQWWYLVFNHDLFPDADGVKYSGFRHIVRKDWNAKSLPNSRPFSENSIAFIDRSRFAPQPYLCFILEKIMAAIGYTLSMEDNCMRQGWMANIFVANSRETIFFRECLPHWTVEEFLTELRNAFGVILYVDGKKVKAVSREAIYEELEYTNIYYVIDERIADISTEGDNKGTTTGNVSYNFSDVVPKLFNIGSDPYDNMKVERVDSIIQENINDRLENGTDEQKENIHNSASLFYRKTIGDRYGVFKKTNKAGEEQYLLERVDHLGPLFRENNFDSGTALNIVPCFMMENKPTYRQRIRYMYEDDKGNDIYKCDIHLPKNEDQTEEEGGRFNGFFVPFLVTEDRLTSYSTPKFSLQQYIETGTGEVETSDGSHKDIMEVAVTAGFYTCDYNVEPNNDTREEIRTAKIPYPIGARWTFSRTDPDEVKEIGTEDYFTLNGKHESKIVQALNGSALKYDGRIVHQFSFTDNEYDPTKLFIINGRRFACQKLELTINEEGVAPLIKGYFFELQ